MLHENNNKFEENEMKVISGAFELKKTKISKIMKPLDKVYKLDANNLLNRSQIIEIYTNG